MALKSHRSRPWLSRLHLTVRLVGLVGLLAALIALNIAHVHGGISSLEDAGTNLVNALSGKESKVTSGTAFLFVGGVAVALLTILLDAIYVSRKAAARRGVAGGNALVQVVLAVALVVGINWFSYQHFARVDLTRDQQFTLPIELQKELEKLRGTTTIVILQTQRTQEQPDKRRQGYFSAADNVLIEKVRDLADQLRRLSTQSLRVVVLDSGNEEFEDRFKELTKGKPALAKAIEEAPESSLLFHTEDEQKREQVQRLSFDSFLQLDVAASLTADPEKRNLVLRQKGVEPLIRRIVNLEERRPRVAVLTGHTLLSTKGEVGMYTAKGLGAALARQGFEVKDIVLRSETGDSAAATPEEMRVEELRDTQASITDTLPVLKRNADLFKQMFAELPRANLVAFSRKYARPLGGSALTDEEDRRDMLDLLRRRLDQFTKMIDDGNKRLEEVKEELKKLPVEEVDAQRRMSDLHGKLTRQLSDCDLIILTRFTRLREGPMIPVQSVSEFYRLDEAQLGAVKDFMKAGKPVLACLGPMNEADEPEGAPPKASDSFEKLLAQLGIWCGPQTILYEVQGQDLAEQRRRRFQQTSITPVPEAAFPGEEEGQTGLATSLRMADRMSGAGLDLRLHYPRPVYYDPESNSLERHERQLGAVLANAPWGALNLAPSLFLKPDTLKAEFRAAGKKIANALGSTPTDPLGPTASLYLKREVPYGSKAILFAGEKSWNESHPFPTREKPVPQYKPPELKDPTRGTRDEKREGPFPIGVAVETTLPKDWYSSSEGDPKSARLVVLGHGGVFVDPVLSPGREKLLLDSCNWLLGRDDLLNREAKEWRYPRLELSDRAKQYWVWGAGVWLPAAFAFLGLSVLLVRRAL